MAETLFFVFIAIALVAMAGFTALGLLHYFHHLKSEYPEMFDEFGRK